jgi:glucose 1-dehydrogenase
MDWFGGKTAVVTGAARGIGRGTAELLVELGARVVALDIDERVSSADFAHGGVEGFVADIAADGAQLAGTLIARYGPIDMLVNNVGIDTEHHFLDLAERDYDRVFNTNLRGPWFLTRAIAASMIEARRRGAIVFVSSLHDTFVRTFPHYSASKAAVAMLVKELAVELGPHGIRVNAVSPGVIHTAHVPAPSDQVEADRLRTLVPLGHMGEPLDVARPIAMLLSDQWSGYITGANVRVDGGLGAHSWSLDPAPGGD